MTDLAKIFETGLRRKYPKGQILLYQGERTLNTYMIEEGYVKLYDIDMQGNEKLILIMGPGDVFPLIWTFEQTNSLMYFYETYSDATLISIEKDRLVRAVDTDHDVAKTMLKYFVTRMKQMFLRIECIEATSAFHKVAQVLSYLAESHGALIAKDTYKIAFPVTHQSIANMAGITRETASLQLKEIEKKKAMSSTREHLIVHTDRLEELITGD